MRYRVVHTAVLHGGEYYPKPERVEAGSEIRLTEAEAARLGDNVVPVAAQVAAMEGGATETATPTETSPQEGPTVAPPSTVAAKPEPGRKVGKMKAPKPAGPPEGQG